jgi:hypothetical protein
VFADEPPRLYVGGIQEVGFLKDYKHCFGEADKALVFWAKCFLNSNPDRHIEHRTVDQDILHDALVMLHTVRINRREWTGRYIEEQVAGSKKRKITQEMEITERECKVTNYRWRYPDGRPPTEKEVFVDLSELTKVVLINKQGEEDHSTLHFNAIGWILATLLWGSDYVDKNQVSHRKHDEKIWSLCVKHAKLLNSVKLDLETLNKAEASESMMWDPDLVLPEFKGEGKSGCHSPLEQFMCILHDTKQLTKEQYQGMHSMLWQAAYCLIDYNQIQQSDPVARFMALQCDCASKSHNQSDESSSSSSVEEPLLKKQRTQ